MSQNRPFSSRPRARVLAKTQERSIVPWITAALIGAGLVLAGSTAKGENHEEVTVSHGYSFFGNLVYDADFEHLNYVNPEAPKGGEISMWWRGTFDDFNPYARVGTTAILSNIGHESILTTVADDPVASYCFLCTTMEYPAGLAWVIFNIREDITFADGRPMTASDIKFSHELFIEQGLPSYRAAFGAMIGDVEVLDDYRIKFTFTDEAPIRDRISLAGGTTVLSESWFEETETRLDDNANEPFLGTGAYMLGEFDFGRRIVYTRNPNYWGADLPIQIGRNNFDSIRIEYFADSQAAFEAFKSGTYTFRAENSSLIWATGYDFQALDNGWVIQEELTDGSLIRGQSFVFNLRREQFQDIRVRRALGMMFNFEWTNETLFYGLYSRVEGFWGNSDMISAGAPSPEELAILEPLVAEGLLDASILTDDSAIPFEQSGDRNAPGRRVLREAGRLLDEAGWEVGDDGMRRNAAGQTLDMEFLESSPAFDRIISPIVENLQRLGVNASLERVDPSQETERTRNYDFDVTTHSFVMPLEPSTGLEQWFGTEASAESSRNLMGLQDPAVDRIIDMIVAAETEEEMKVAVRALDRVLRSYVIWIPQWYNPNHWVAYYDMFRHPDELPPYARGELDFWWYDAERAAELEAEGAF